MDHDLIIGSSVTVGTDCPLSYRVAPDDELVTFFCGTAPWDFEFAMTTAALRTFVHLGTEALAELGRQPSSGRDQGQLNVRRARRVITRA